MVIRILKFNYQFWRSKTLERRNSHNFESKKLNAITSDKAWLLCSIILKALKYTKIIVFGINSSFWFENFKVFGW